MINRFQVGDTIRAKESPMVGTVVKIEYKRDAKGKAFDIASIDVLFRNNAYFTIKPADFDRIYLIKEAKSIHPKETGVEA
jgi:hypothetical protein